MLSPDDEQSQKSLVTPMKKDQSPSRKTQQPYSKSVQKSKPVIDKKTDISPPKKLLNTRMTSQQHSIQATAEFIKESNETYRSTSSILKPKSIDDSPIGKRNIHMRVSTSESHTNQSNRNSKSIRISSPAPRKSNIVSNSGSNFPQHNTGLATGKAKQNSNQLMRLTKQTERPEDQTNRMALQYKDLSQEESLEKSHDNSQEIYQTSDNKKPKRPTKLSLSIIPPKASPHVKNTSENVIRKSIKSPIKKYHTTHNPIFKNSILKVIQASDASPLKGSRFTMNQNSPLKGRSLFPYEEFEERPKEFCLVIPTQKGDFTYRLVEVSSKKFLLKEKQHYCKLIADLGEWIFDNPRINQRRYQNYIQDRIDNAPPIEDTKFDIGIQATVDMHSFEVQAEISTENKKNQTKIQTCEIE